MLLQQNGRTTRPILPTTPPPPCMAMHVHVRDDGWTGTLACPRVLPYAHSPSTSGRGREEGGDNRARRRGQGQQLSVPLSPSLPLGPALSPSHPLTIRMLAPPPPPSAISHPPICPPHVSSRHASPSTHASYLPPSPNLPPSPSPPTNPP